MKAYCCRLFFLLIFITLSYLEAFGNDYLFYNCDTKKQELKLKALYFYTLNKQTHKLSTINSLQKSGYENLGNSNSLLIRNKSGLAVSTKLINRICKINKNIYRIKIGSMAGNPNPMGSCGAFSSHWIVITRNNNIILPKTVFQYCTLQSAISEIILNSSGDLRIFYITPYAQEKFHDTNPNPNEYTTYIGQGLVAITSDIFNNIWVASYQGRYVAKINQDRKVSYFNINYHPMFIASDNAGNIFVLAENHIIKFSKRGIITTFKTISDASSIFIDPHDNIWIDSWESGKLLKLNENGRIIGIYQTGKNSGASTMAMDKAGNLWITANYGRLEILYADGFMKKCPQCCIRNIATSNNTAWVIEGTLLDNSVSLRHINHKCQSLLEAYKLDFQPSGLAIDNNANIWISGDRFYKGGVLEELTKTGKHTYFVGLSAGPLTIDKFGNIWVISDQDAVKEFIRKVQPKTQPSSALNPHLPVAIHHTFPENNVGN